MAGDEEGEGHAVLHRRKQGVPENQLLHLLLPLSSHTLAGVEEGLSGQPSSNNDPNLQLNKCSR